MRLLFGVGARAEAARVLLTCPPSRSTLRVSPMKAGYAKRNVNDTLTAFATAGVMHARWAGNERRFAASRPRWAALLDVERPPGFVSWVHLLPALAALLTWLDDTATSDASDYLVASRARDLGERIGPDIEATGVELPRSHAAAYLPTYEELVTRLLAVVAQR
jgi:hypothetical protein